MSPRCCQCGGEEDEGSSRDARKSLAEGGERFQRVSVSNAAVLVLCLRFLSLLTIFYCSGTTCPKLVLSFSKPIIAQVGMVGGTIQIL